MPTGPSRLSWWQVPGVSEAVCHLPRGVLGGQGKCAPPKPVGGGGSPSLFSSLAFALSPPSRHLQKKPAFSVCSAPEKRRFYKYKLLIRIVIIILGSMHISHLNLVLSSRRKPKKTTWSCSSIIKGPGGCYYATGCKSGVDSEKTGGHQAGYLLVTR